METGSSLVGNQDGVYAIAAEGISQSQDDYETQTGPAPNKAHIILRFIRYDVSSIAWRWV